MKIRIAVNLLAFIAATSIFAQSPTSPKPPVGVPADAKSFNGKWYRVYTEKGTWKMARDKCSKLGGQLAVVPDEPTHAFIKGFANSLRLWLGATDEKVEGQWMWVDGVPMTFKIWSPGEPSTVKHGERWLYIEASGTWNNGPVNDSAVVGYICEWKQK